jgi:hypothetical protein
MKPWQAKPWFHRPNSLLILKSTAVIVAVCSANIAFFSRYDRGAIGDHQKSTGCEAVL